MIKKTILQTSKYSYTLMKKVFLLFSILIYSISTLYSKSPVIDSLLNELKKADHDTLRVELLNELSYKMRSSNTDSALQFANQAKEKADALIKSSEPECVKIGKINLAKILNNIGYIYRRKGNIALALESYMESLKIREESGDKKSIADSYINIANLHTSQSNYNIALEYNQKAFENYNLKNYDEGVARSHTNIGIIYYYKGEFDEALKNYMSALKINEKQNNKKAAARAYNNIGLIHFEQGNYSSAVEYYNKSLEIKESLGDKKGIATGYNNIGKIYFTEKKYELAFNYYFKSLKIREELGDKSGMALSYDNLGSSYSNKGDYKKSMEYFEKSLTIWNEINDKESTALTLTNIARANNSQKKYYKAIEYAEQALDIANELGTLPRKMDSYQALSDAYEGIFNLSKSLQYYKLYSQVKDSILNEESTRQYQQLEALYQTEKKQQEIEKTTLMLEKKDAEYRRQKLQTRVSVIMFIIAGILGFVIFRGYRHKKKSNGMLIKKNAEIICQKEEIESQRDELQKQHKIVVSQKKEITDSIIYAKNIQSAVLPDDNLVDEIIPDSFIIYLPRDIVSGDFYWMRKIKNYSFIANVDCTGHGVPGAIMSMLGSSFLNEIVTEIDLSSAVILNSLRKMVKESLHQQGVEGEAKDGMDISFYIINYKTLEFQFSGAYNPIYIVRQGEIDEDIVKKFKDNKKVRISSYNDEIESGNKTVTVSLIEIKADRQPIAIYSYERDFTFQTLQLKKGDCLYTSTDGYVDQFGGPNEKKFNTRKFKKLLLANFHKPMDEQKKILEDTFYNWKGELEQIDDVLVIGTRV